MYTIKQKIILRENYLVDNGYFGFSEWEREYEKIEKFVEKVTNIANELISNKLIKVENINYPDTTMAIIVYKEYERSRPRNERNKQN